MIHSGRIRQIRLVTVDGETVVSPAIVKLRLSTLSQSLADMGLMHHSDASLVLMDYADDRPFIEHVIRTMFDRPLDAEQAITAVFAPHEPTRFH